MDEKAEPVRCSCGNLPVVKDKLIGGMNPFPIVLCTACGKEVDLSPGLSLTYQPRQYETMRALAVLKWNREMGATQ